MKQDICFLSLVMSFCVVKSQEARVKSGCTFSVGVPSNSKMSISSWISQSAGNSGTCAATALPDVSRHQGKAYCSEHHRVILVS